MRWKRYQKLPLNGYPSIVDVLKRSKEGVTRVLSSDVGEILKSILQRSDAIFLYWWTGRQDMVMTLIQFSSIKYVLDLENTIKE